MNVTTNSTVTTTPGSLPHSPHATTARFPSDLDHDDAASLLNAAAGRDGAERQALLNEVVAQHLPLARRLARRYAHRGEDLADLEQVAALALVKAAQGFRPEVGAAFASFAIPTVLGELKRHFRSAAWTVRPPRRLQELQAAITPASDELSQILGRPPTSAEIAAHLDVEESEVREALACQGCFNATSLEDAGSSSDADRPTPADRLGYLDPGFDHIETVGALGSAVSGLTAEDREILALRFYYEWSQQRIADEIGISQVQVCRRLKRILKQLHEAIDPSPAHGSLTPHAA